MNRRIKISILILGLEFAIALPTLAQNITLDGTLGDAQTLTGPNYTIRQEDGQTVGNNLFHSFGRFGLNAGEAAIFKSKPNIQNILSRVTGGFPSFIDGVIETKSASVNLFLMNPSGIIFGANASLKVNGSFVATSANAIQFGEQGFFSTTEPNSPALLTVNPSALFFNQIQAGQIKNQSIAPAGVDDLGNPVKGLRVLDGRSLLLVAGDIVIDRGDLKALGGRIELASVGGIGTVGLNIDGSKVSLTVPDELARADISIINGSQVRVAGSNGGDIFIYARNLEVKGGSSIAAGIGTNISSPNVQAGDINFNVTDNITIQEGSTAQNLIYPFNIGRGGNINITTNTLSLNSGAVLNTITLGTGDAGDININAGDRVSIDGIIYKGSISTVVSSVIVTLNGIPFVGMGKAGNITITTGSLSLTNGSRLVTSTLGIGNAGNITINARDTISFDGVDSNRNPSGAFSSVVPNALGNGGDISINTQQLTIQNGATITASSAGKGNAGNILNITARNLTLDNGSITTTSISGNGGNIENLQVRDLLLLRNQSKISTTAGTGQSGGGNGGNININAGFIVAVPDENSDITANAFEGSGGNINITTNRIFGLTFRNQETLQSDITASSRFGINGIIAINTPDVNPLSALDTLPVNPVDAEKLVAQNVCAIKDSKIAGGSSFVITGKGGLPPNPNETLTNLTGIVEWATNDRSQTRIETPVIIRSRPQTHQSEPITPIQGWVKNSDGTITLTTTASTVTPQSPSFTPQDCRTAS